MSAYVPSDELQLLFLRQLWHICFLLESCPSCECRHSQEAIIYPVQELGYTSESKFVFVQNTSITLSLFLSEIVCLSIYGIFRIIFEHIAGFGFYFNAIFLLLFLGEIVFSILAETIFAVLIYKKA